MFLRTFCRGITGSVAQGMLLEDCRGDDPNTDPQSTQSKTSVMISQYHTAHRVGQFLSVCASGYLLTYSSMTSIFASMAAFHLGSIGFALAMLETTIRPIDQDVAELEDISAKMHELHSIATDQPEFKSILQYAFLAMVNPTYEARMAYYLLDDRHLTVMDVSIVTIAQTVAASVTPTVYSFFFQKSKLGPLLKKLTLATVPASLLPLLITSGLSEQLGINETAVAAVSGFLLTMTTDMQMLPANVIVAQLAKPGFEGSSFSLLTVVEGIGRVGSNISSGILPPLLGASAWNFYGNMSAYVVICTAMQLLPLSAIKGSPGGSISPLPTLHNTPSMPQLYIAGPRGKKSDTEDKISEVTDDEDDLIRAA